MSKCIYRSENGVCLLHYPEYCVEGPCDEETEILVEEVVEKGGGLIVKVRRGHHA